MTPNTDYKIGFCCKWLEANGVSGADMNQRGTTITALKKLPFAQRAQRMLELVDYNCRVLERQLAWIALQPVNMRMFRITSEFVPASAHPDFAEIHSHPDFRAALALGLGWVRDFADMHQIRLCTHPAQFTTLCSLNQDTVERSILDLEYHADLASLMGYGTGWHPSGFAINIHGNVRLDPGLTRFQSVVRTRLSPVAQNLLTIENDEFSCGVDDLVTSRVGELIPLVLDIHHHWIASSGEYVLANDPRIDAFKKSWQGTRPLGHLSISQPDLVAPWESHILPDYQTFQARGLKPSKLRAHSHAMWNTAVLDWAASHLEWTDLEVESKGKNLASLEMLEWLTKGLAPQPRAV